MASISRINRDEKPPRWRVRWYDPDLNGKAQSMTYASRVEAEEWKRRLDANKGSLKAIEAEIARSKESGPTVEEAFERHIGQLMGTEKFTLKKYRDNVRLYFSEIADRKVSGFNRDDVIGWMRWMESRGLSPKTIADIRGLLSAMLTTAIHDGHLVTNPCKGVRLPKDMRVTGGMHLMTHEIWAAIMVQMDPSFIPFFNLLIGTGFRLNEATVLGEEDFMLDQPTSLVKVDKTWKRSASGGYLIGPPKTRRSRRTVSIAPSTAESVRPLVENANGGFVFTLKRGGVIRPANLYRTAWYPACEAAGLRGNDRPRIHDIRHTHASWMIAGGMDIFTLSRRLGHESIVTTSNTYGHLLPDALFKSAAIAQAVLEASPPTGLPELTP